MSDELTVFNAEVPIADGRGPYAVTGEYFPDRNGRQARAAHTMNMSPTYSQLVAQGDFDGVSQVGKFGRNGAVDSNIAPICGGGVYRTPTSVVTLEAISTSVNDTAAGSGAQQLTLQYLDANFELQLGTIEMNGTVATTSTLAGVIRLLRVFVSRSGTYATATVPSQLGTITLREEGAGQTWSVIPELVSGFGAGQSLIGAYTVPAGFDAYILSQTVYIESAKVVDLYFFKRPNANDVTAPYSGAMRVQNVFVGKTSVFTFTHSAYEKYEQYTDMGYMATIASGTADVAIEFEIRLVPRT